MFEEALTSIRNSIRERISSPLLGTFLIAWVIWNHRFLTVLFSDTAYSEKFSYIDSELYAGDFSCRLLHQFVYPSISTALFIWGYPILSRYVYNYWRTKQKEMRDIRLKIDGETLLTVNESRKLQTALVSLEQEHERQLAERDKKIRDLKDAITAQLPTNSPASKNSVKADVPDVNQAGQTPDKTQLAILAELAREERAGERSYISHVEESLVKQGFDLIAIKLAIEELGQQGMVFQNYDSHAKVREHYLELRAPGRKAALAIANKREK